MPPQTRSASKATPVDPPQTRSVTKAGKRNSDLLVRLGTKVHKRKQPIEVDSLGSESDGDMSEPEANDKTDTERAATVELVDNKLYLFEMPKKRRPEYWQFLKLVAPGKTPPAGGWKSTHAKQFYCLKCKVRYAYKSGNSTTVSSHMKSYHQKEIDEFLVKTKNQRSTISKFVTKRPRLSKTPCSKDDYKKLKQILVEWLCKNLRPFSIVEDKKFREFCTLLQRCHGEFEMLGRTAIAEEVKNHAETCRIDFKSDVKEQCNYYCFTTDAWTSRAKDSYISLTLHFVTKELEMKSCMLEIDHLPGSHSGQALAERIRSLILDWKLNLNNCSMMVTDNGSNMVLASKLLGVEHMSCFAHSLHLVVQAIVGKAALASCSDPGDVFEEEECVVSEEPPPPPPPIVPADGSSTEVGLSLTNVPQLQDNVCKQQVNVSQQQFNASIQQLNVNAPRQLTVEEALLYTQRAVERFRKLVRYFHRSPKALSKFKSLQTTKPVGLVLDVVTRWNSTYDMLARLASLKQCIQRWYVYLETEEGQLQFKNYKLDKPTDEDWMVLDGLILLLQDFKGVTEVLSGSFYPTVTLILPSLRLWKTKLNRKDFFNKLKVTHVLGGYFGNTLERLEKVRHYLMTKFDKRFQNLPALVTWSTLLDPRFVKSEHLSQEEREQSEKALIDKAVTLMINEKGRADVEVILSDSEDSQTSHKSRSFSEELFCQGVKPKAVSLKSTLVESEQGDTDTYRRQAVNEFALYCSKAANVPCKGDPLAWWKENLSDSQMLVPLVRYVFGIVATSVPSEQLFSVAGNAISLRRARLKPTTVRNILFINKNC